MGRFYCQGYQAFHRKEWRHHCPYAWWSVEGQQWWAGWSAANSDPYYRENVKLCWTPS